MKDTQQLVDFAGEQFSSLGKITASWMLLGIALHADGVRFGLVANGKIHLFADPKMAKELDFLGCQALGASYDNGKSQRLTSYWNVPDSTMQTPAELLKWGQRALEFARTQQKKN